MNTPDATLSHRCGTTCGFRNRFGFVVNGAFDARSTNGCRIVLITNPTYLLAVTPGAYYA